MRIAELSRLTGVSVPTIKYYQREGLLPPAEFTSPNQARYDDEHVRRLRLIRTLIDIGRLPIATIREVLDHLDQPHADLHQMLGQALKATGCSREPITDEAVAAADRYVDELIIRRGWHVGPYAPARQTVAEVVAALRGLGADDIVMHLDEYAESAERIAATDLEIVRRRAEPHEMVYGAVIATILGDTLVAGLRRLAQEDASARMFARPHSETSAVASAR
jgi:DNA-binding transcriptional MerR regulator